MWLLSLSLSLSMCLRLGLWLCLYLLLCSRWREPQRGSRRGLYPLRCFCSAEAETAKVAAIEAAIEAVSTSVRLVAKVAGTMAMK